MFDINQLANWKPELSGHIYKMSYLPMSPKLTENNQFGSQSLPTFSNYEKQVWKKNWKALLISGRENLKAWDNFWIEKKIADVPNTS